MGLLLSTAMMAEVFSLLGGGGAGTSGDDEDINLMTPASGDSKMITRVLNTSTPSPSVEALTAKDTFWRLQPLPHAAQTQEQQSRGLWRPLRAAPGQFSMKWYCFVAFTMTE